MRTRQSIIVSAIISLSLLACGEGQDKAATADSTTAVKQTFPEPTDSTAAGLHPFYPTESNILGKWVLPDPTDTTPEDTQGYFEFLADHTLKVEGRPDLKPLKWELNGNVLVMTHESGDPLEKGRILSDTLVVEAISDTSIHYFNLHEPNFIMYLKRKK
jgi:hypothetical protein